MKQRFPIIFPPPQPEDIDHPFFMPPPPPPMLGEERPEWGIPAPFDHEMRPEGPKGHHNGPRGGKFGEFEDRRKDKDGKGHGRHLKDKKKEGKHHEKDMERFDGPRWGPDERDGKHRPPRHCAVMRFGSIVMAVWGLLNVIFFFKNFRAYKNTVIMIEEFNPQKQLKKKKGKKGKKARKTQEPVEESKEEVKFERASDEES